MGLDIFVHYTCSKCRKPQSFEVNRDDEGEPFNINNEEQWKILERYYSREIADCRKAWQSFPQDHKDFLAVDMLSTLNPDAIKEKEGFFTEKERERAFITHELKFDEDAFYFLKCEYCGKLLSVVCYSY